ncbi:rhodanese-like domain-containing protein [Kurthia sibirica]|uniref:Rhodanese n=1 Tax=Kurthia sibirica TaxID=202750 RepID=A0A2U3AR50_9BACL|nr:rhodanese-like domain-containing protein [Kurthia sibirica]PWI26976.1 rhodanese [Kurthia sibirica]GEK32474.1 rhodanese-like domain-containing protein [Kurthia sibirica]
MKTITTDEVLNLFDANEDLNILDVREDAEVANGIIPGAIHIPLGQISERMAELDGDQAYIIVCKAGGRSFQAASYLEEKGFDTTNLEGGMDAWDGELEF